MTDWIVRDLIYKLTCADVVEKLAAELRFTDKFCKYYIELQNDDESLNGRLPWWRKMLTSFSPDLCLLSDREIATTVILFDYYLKNKGSSIKEETHGA